MQKNIRKAPSTTFNILQKKQNKNAIYNEERIASSINTAIQGSKIIDSNTGRSKKIALQFIASTVKIQSSVERYSSSIFDQRKQDSHKKLFYIGDGTKACSEAHKIEMALKSKKSHLSLASSKHISQPILKITIQSTKPYKASNSQQSKTLGTSKSAAAQSFSDPKQPEISRSRNQTGLVSGFMRTQSSSISATGRRVPKQINQIQKLSKEQIKLEMVEAFSKIKLDVYSDILRIKKPQAVAFTASQILCKLVNSFRGGSQKMNNDLLFQTWEAIQDFIHKKPNVIKFNLEITQLIQHMIMSQDYLCQLKSGQLKNHLNKLIRIQQQYFGLDTQETILKRFQMNRNFYLITNLALTVIRYVLYEAGRHEFLNLGPDDDGKNSHRSYLSDKISLTGSQQIGRSMKQTQLGKTDIQFNKTLKADDKLSSVSGCWAGSHSKDNSQAAYLSAERSRQTTSALRKIPDYEYGSYSNLNLCKGDSSKKDNLSKSPINDQKQGHLKTRTNLYGRSPHTQKIEARQAESDSKKIKETPINLSRRQKTSASKLDSKLTNRITSCQKAQNNQDKNSVPANLYELMLEKQKQITVDRYERLTLNSVSKKHHQNQKQTSGGVKDFEDPECILQIIEQQSASESIIKAACSPHKTYAEQVKQSSSSNQKSQKNSNQKSLQAYNCQILNENLNQNINSNGNEQLIRPNSTEKVPLYQFQSSKSPLSQSQYHSTVNDKFLTKQRKTRLDRSKSRKGRLETSNMDNQDLNEQQHCVPGSPTIIMKREASKYIHANKQSGVSDSQSSPSHQKYSSYLLPLQIKMGKVQQVTVEQIIKGIENESFEDAVEVELEVMVVPASQPQYPTQQHASISDFEPQQRLEEASGTGLLDKYDQQQSQGNFSSIEIQINRNQMHLFAEETELNIINENSKQNSPHQVVDLRKKGDENYENRQAEGHQIETVEDTADLIKEQNESQLQNQKEQAQAQIQEQQQLKDQENQIQEAGEKLIQTGNSNCSANRSFYQENYADSPDQSDQSGSPRSPDSTQQFFFNVYAEAQRIALILKKEHEQPQTVIFKGLDLSIQEDFKIYINDENKIENSDIDKGQYLICNLEHNYKNIIQTASEQQNIGNKNENAKYQTLNEIKQDTPEHYNQENISQGGSTHDRNFGSSQMKENNSCKSANQTFQEENLSQNYQNEKSKEEDELQISAININNEKYIKENKKAVSQSNYSEECPSSKETPQNIRSQSSKHQESEPGDKSFVIYDNIFGNDKNIAFELDKSTVDQDQYMTEKVCNKKEEEIKVSDDNDTDQVDPTTSSYQSEFQYIQKAEYDNKDEEKSNYNCKIYYDAKLFIATQAIQVLEQRAKDNDQKQDNYMEMTTPIQSTRPAEIARNWLPHSIFSQDQQTDVAGTPYVGIIGFNQHNQIDLSLLSSTETHQNNYLQIDQMARSMDFFDLEYDSAAESAEKVNQFYSNQNGCAGGKSIAQQQDRTGSQGMQEESNKSTPQDNPNLSGLQNGPPQQNYDSKEVIILEADIRYAGYYQDYQITTQGQRSSLSQKKRQGSYSPVTDQMSIYKQRDNLCHTQQLQSSQMSSPVNQVKIEQIIGYQAALISENGVNSDFNFDNQACIKRKNKANSSYVGSIKNMQESDKITKHSEPLEKNEKLPESESNSELCMQEIISPFRMQNICQDNKIVSQTNLNCISAKKVTDWQINPVKIPLDSFNNKGDNIQTQHIDSQVVIASSEEQTSNSCNTPYDLQSYQSQSESPNRQDLYQIYSDAQNTQKYPKIISPGKLKQHFVEVRALIVNKLSETEQQIEQNSPSKNSFVNRQLIEELKERRLQQRSKSRENTNEVASVQNKTNESNIIRQLQEKIIKTKNSTNFVL